MTVEQQSLPPAYNNQKTREELELAKIREVTGVIDNNIIHQAIRACSKDGKYDVTEVINVLIAQPLKKPSSEIVQVTSVTQPVATDNKASQVIPSGAGGVIDLTNDNPDGDDLQKAIAASLQDTPGILGGQISREEQDISRILEASLAESKAGTKRKRGELWFADPLNPHERKRQDHAPVGLKNVGNTCWFSAVIQSLFQLPVFRKLVLGFSTPAEVSQSNTYERRNLRFMQELRQLFALMIGSRRKYVDPSKALDVLREAFQSSGNVSAESQQQDVSEFQHKLLEWLEDAFQSSNSRPTSPAHEAAEQAVDGIQDDKLTNPMVELFYGQFLTEGVFEGKIFSNKETFGQYPLQVNGFKDIHESLEMATARGEIESASADVTTKSGQEQWFTRLPPVLTFELSRFQFNQHLGRPEKIHNKLEFPQTIHMDRYMECNKLITRQKREEIKRLKEELVQLQTRLDKFINYGSGCKRFPLQDVLQYALEFAETKPEKYAESDSSCTDVEMGSPPSHASMSTDSNSSPAKSSPAPDVTLTSSASTPQKCPPQPACSFPAPKHVSQDELHMLQGCLTRWRTEVEIDVKELQDSVESLEEAINNTYSDPNLQKYTYRLHAVLVHEGQAASGHYWAYVFSTRHNCWLKFNDITITEVTCEALQKEGFGGYHNTSAYCLMYVDANRGDLVEESIDKDTGQCAEDTDSLPEDLRQIVDEDNRKFAKEIEEWDLEQKRKAQLEAEAKASHSSGTQTGAVKMSLACKHAHMASKSTIALVERAIDGDNFNNKGADSILIDICNHELKRLQHVAVTLDSVLPKQDSRLDNVLIYFYANNAPIKPVIHRAMLEQFVFLTELDSEPSAKKLREAAVRILESQRRIWREQDEEVYKRWHEDFSTFRKATCHFLHGIDAFHKESCEEALQCLKSAVELNQSLLTNHGSPGRQRIVDSKLLSYYKRQCLLQLNEMAAAQFESDSNVDDALQMVMQLVLPCLPSLLSNSSQDDQTTAEEIRERWFAFLGQEDLGEKGEKLQDFLSKLLDPPAELKPRHAFQVAQINDLTNLRERYNTTMLTAEKYGFLEAAAGSK